MYVAMSHIEFMNDVVCTALCGSCGCIRGHLQTDFGMLNVIMMFRGEDFGL